MESPTKGNICVLRRSSSCQRAKHTRCLEELVADAGCSGKYCSHQWHHVEEAVYFWILELRSVCKMNSRQAPGIPRRIVWLVGAHNAKHWFRGRKLPELSHCSRAIRDTVKKLTCWVMLDHNENESDMLNSASTNPGNIVLLTKLQDSQVEHFIWIRSQDLKCECVKALEKTRIEKDNISRKTQTPTRT